MLAAIKAFFSANIAKFIEIMAIVGAGAAAVTGIYRAGKKNEQVDELVTVQKQEETAHAIEDKNHAELRAGDAANKLRTDWSK